MIQNVIKFHTAIAYANNADLEEQSDQVLHCYHFTKYFKKQLHKKLNLGKKRME